MIWKPKVVAAAITGRHPLDLPHHLT